VERKLQFPEPLTVPYLMFECDHPPGFVDVVDVLEQVGRQTSASRAGLGTWPACSKLSPGWALPDWGFFFPRNEIGRDQLGLAALGFRRPPVPALAAPTEGGRALTNREGSSL
jgi:hypothetical protein